MKTIQVMNLMRCMHKYTDNNNFTYYPLLYFLLGNARSASSLLNLIGDNGGLLAMQYKTLFLTQMMRDERPITIDTIFDVRNSSWAVLFLTSV